MRYWSLLGLALLVSCIRSTTTTCADGTLCRDGTVCAPDGERTLCVTQEQLAACSDKTPRAPCGADRCYPIDDGLVCLPIGCGNGFADPEENEQCDDGNTVSEDGCSADCLSTERCGNGVVDPLFGEQCDDDNIVSHDGCSSRCGVEALETRIFQAPDLSPRRNAAFTFDTKRARLVELGGITGASTTGYFPSVLEWDRQGVREHEMLSAPDGRVSPALAYDVRRGVTVMFGGNRDSPLADTWEWTGTSWRIVDAVGPLARFGAAMAYDEVLDRMVLFGGSGKDTFRDTWQLQGGAWTLLAMDGPLTNTSTMTFDPAAGVMVLVAAGAQWELAGSTWTRIGDVPARADRPAWIVFDVGLGQRVLVGTDGTELRQWAFTQQQWQPLARPTVPAAGVLGVVADRVRGGILARIGTTVAAWSTDGALTYITPPTVPVDARVKRSAAAATDLRRREVVVFGGNQGDRTTPSLIATTWIFDGVTWRDRTPTTPPPARWEHAMVYDAVNDRVVLFGGRTQTGLLADTWLWDGATWTRATPPVSPSARAGHAMAYDVARERVVLFGGAAATGAQSDVWEWDGTTWSQRVILDGPAPRIGAAMSYDPVGGGVIVFGGGATATLSMGYDDTWRLGPAGWELQTPVVVPSQRLHGTLTWVPARRRAVLIGGEVIDNSGTMATMRPTLDSWEWDGVRWRPLPGIRRVVAEHVAFASPDGGAVVTLGGTEVFAQSTVSVGQFEHRWTDGGAYETCSSRVDADGDGAAGCADPDCWSSCTPVCAPEQVGCPTQPACGDGTCSPLETSWLCPADCGAAPVVCGDALCEPDEVCTGDEATSTCP